jgi:Domain of unknown function (DUF4340)
MKKINNKVLAIGLLVLIGIFVVTRLYRTPGLEGNVRKELVNIDAASISEVRIAKADSVIILKKENNQWTVTKNEVKLEADSGLVARMIQSTKELRAKRMASRKKEKWAEFQVDASQGTTVSLFADGDKEAEFVVGKFGFNQAPGGGGGQFGGQNIAAYTYVRLADEEEVYIVDGFLNASYPAAIGEWKLKQQVSDSIPPLLER